MAPRTPRSSKTRRERTARDKLLLGLLHSAGVTAPVRFKPQPDPGQRYGILAKGDLTLLGVIMDHRPGRWNGGKVILPKPLHVYSET